ncbi:hypothetical protein BDW16_0834 [Sphingomonas koreensis]|nr:hypothetical protein BDW16_0834 [Sphingomonas koreensis]
MRTQFIAGIGLRYDVRVGDGRVFVRPLAGDFASKHVCRAPGASPG